MMEPQIQKLDGPNSEIISVCRLCLEISTLSLYPVKFVELFLFSVVPELVFTSLKESLTLHGAHSSGSKQKKQPGCHPTLLSETQATRYAKNMLCISYLTPGNNCITKTSMECYKKLSLSKNPGVCSECINTLTQAYNFKSRCLNNQERILKYYNTVKESINLFDLIKDTSFNKGNVEKSSGNVENDPKQAANVDIKAEQSVIKETSQQTDISSENITEGLPRVDTEEVATLKTEQKVAACLDNVIDIQDSDIDSFNGDDSDMECVADSDCNRTVGKDLNSSTVANVNKESATRVDTEEVPRVDTEEVSRADTEEVPRDDTEEVPRVDPDEVATSKTEQKVAVCLDNVIDIKDSAIGGFNGDDSNMEFVADSDCNRSVQKDLNNSAVGNVDKESATEVDTEEVPRVDTEEVATSKTEQRVAACLDNVIDIKDSDIGSFNGDDSNMEFLEDSDCNRTVQKDLNNSAVGNVDKESATEVDTEELPRVDTEEIATLKTERRVAACLDNVTDIQDNDVGSFNGDNSDMECVEDSDCNRTVDEDLNNSTVGNVDKESAKNSPEVLGLDDIIFNYSQEIDCEKLDSSCNNESIQQSTQENLQSDGTSNLSKPGPSKPPEHHLLWSRLSSRLYQCLLCQKTFAQPSTLSSHLLTKHKDAPNLEVSIPNKIHYCTYCKYRTIVKLQLHQHIFSKHEKIGGSLKGKSYQCDHCPYTTLVKGRLVIHLKIHSTTKLFRCVHCDKRFKGKRWLDQHHIRHHPEQIQGKSNGQVP